MNWHTELGAIARPVRMPDAAVRFTCPNPDCETDVDCDARVIGGEWDVVTPDQCAVCLRVITGTDRHALAEQASQVLSETHAAAKGAADDALIAYWRG